jgi:hypothetical protein
VRLTCVEESKISCDSQLHAVCIITSLGSAITCKVTGSSYCCAVVSALFVHTICSNCVVLLICSVSYTHLAAICACACIHIVRSAYTQIKWSGNAKFVVEVGRIAFPMTITLSNIRFSGKLRAELGPLVPKVTATFITITSNCHFCYCSLSTAVDVAVAVAVAYTLTLIVSRRALAVAHARILFKHHVL